MILNKKQELRQLIVFLVFYYILPITLLTVGWLRFEYRHGVIFFLCIILIAYAIDKGIKPADLGLRWDNLRKALLYNLIFSIIAIILAVIGIRTGLLRSVTYDRSVLFFIYYVIISAPLQEFIFRSLMFYELGRFFNSKLIKIAVTTIIFSLAHVMYHNIQVLFVTAILGLVLGIIYTKKPNFWGVALTHILVGMVLVFLDVV